MYDQEKPGKVPSQSKTDRRSQLAAQRGFFDAVNAPKIASFFFLPFLIFSYLSAILLFIVPLLFFTSL